MTTPLVPPTIRWGGIIALIQSGIGLAYAFFLIYRELTGQKDQSIVYESAEANTWVGYGTAGFFLIIFGAVFAGAINMMRGKKWGRGPVIMLNMIFLPVAYYMFSEGRYSWAAVVAVSAVICLAMLFNARSVNWAANQY